MTSTTRDTKARLKASELVTLLATRYQDENTEATYSEAYTFTCGYLESMLASIMADHPSVHKHVSERVAEINERMAQPA